MQAIQVRQVGSFETRGLPEPTPGRGDVRVRVAVTGLCRTDLKIIEQGHRDLVLPRVPGEEVVGTVDALGAGADVAWLGRRVYVYPGTSCGECRPCRSGAGNLCRSMRIMGFHRDGGFATYVACPVASLIALPDGLTFDDAVLAEPLSCGLNALELAAVQPGESLAVWGAGPAGALLARAAAARGAMVTAVDPDPGRRSRTGALAEAPAGAAFDVAVVAVGHPDAYRDALACLAPRGRLVVFSGLAPPDARQAVDLNQLHYHEQTLVGAYGCSLRHGAAAIALIAQRRVVVSDLVSHRLPLTELAAALRIVRERRGLKVLLYP